MDKKELVKRIIDLQDEAAFESLFHVLKREGLFEEEQMESLTVYLFLLEDKKRNHPLLECSLFE